MSAADIVAMVGCRASASEVASRPSCMADRAMVERAKSISPPTERSSGIATSPKVIATLPRSGTWNLFDHLDRVASRPDDMVNTHLIGVALVRAVLAGRVQKTVNSTA